MDQVVTGAGKLGRTGRILLAAVLALAGAVVAQQPARADTMQFRGVNWADQRDNFVNGVLYVSGLGSADTYASAAVVADRVVGQLYAITGANTVRMPINEPTVANYWNTYTGAIDQALTKGKVILAYWAYSGGRPSTVAAYDRMWDTVVARYAGNSNAYFEVINEPYGYSTGDLNNLYNAWLGRHSNVPRGRVILDGAGLAQNVAAVGQDGRLNDTLLAVHDYSFFAGFEDETSWANHIASSIGGYAARTVATEWGGPMSPGSKNGVSYDTIDYNIPSGSFFADYIRGVSSKLRELGVGGVYWPGLRDGDWYSLTKRSGSGSTLNLTLTNPSGLNRLQYSWGIGTGGSTTVRIVNAATGRYADGLGRTAAGSDVGQAPAGTGLNQQWVVENSGTYVRIRNLGSGLYVDGMGRTANGSAAGQYTGGTSANQQWSVVTDANNVRLRNRATGLYLDGMGRTATGASAGQYSDSTSANQRWKIVAAG
ncbi:RICIN domain-containing protein [Actinoplanes sp. NPDC051513]|uniref:RICIN domain-containing protein n=1 Tax=Actinoplanes sp. NPDC051513 TaxID=3363908 RepID=UPI0037B87AC2